MPTVHPAASTKQPGPSTALVASSCLVALPGGPKPWGKALPAPPSDSGFSILSIRLEMRAEAQGGYVVVSGWDEAQVSLATHAPRATSTQSVSDTGTWHQDFIPILALPTAGSAAYSALERTLCVGRGFGRCSQLSPST